jgi:hypothetical protein
MLHQQFVWQSKIASNERNKVDGVYIWCSPSPSGSMKGDPALAASVSSKTIGRLARLWHDGRTCGVHIPISIFKSYLSKFMSNYLGYLQ